LKELSIETTIRKATGTKQIQPNRRITLFWTRMICCKLRGVSYFADVNGIHFHHFYMQDFLL